MTDNAKLYDEDKVADALKHSWVYRLPKWMWPYAQLARWERPIGWQLLMWPCWWSFMLVLTNDRLNVYNELMELARRLSHVHINMAEGQFEHWLALFFFIPLLIFALGAFFMRGAGCTYNDLADVDIDDQVARTRSRPLPSGRISKKQAALFLLLQCLGGFVVLVLLSRGFTFAFWLGVASLITVAIYPFMKRITWWPQLFLGFAFSWGALMGWAVVAQSLSLAPILLYIGTIFWVIGYDTIYAHQDREDDTIVGVKSTARLFGEKSRKAISTLYVLTLSFVLASFILAIPPNTIYVMPAYIGLALGALHMFWQIKNLDIHNGDQCLKLFKSNSRFGLILFTGLMMSFLSINYPFLMSVL